MDWREEYKRRLTSAEDAVGIVEKDDLVVIPIAGPRGLPRALRRASHGAGARVPRARSPTRVRRAPRAGKAGWGGMNKPLHQAAALGKGGGRRLVRLG